MNNQTPFFSMMRRKLAALGRRTAKNNRNQTMLEMQAHCGEFIRKETLLLPETGKGSRKRKFDFSLVFWCFIWQMLRPGSSCRAVVRHVQATFEDENMHYDENTSGYCQARMNLPEAWMQQALEDSSCAAEKLSTQGIQGWNRPVKVVDGTSVQLADTAKNRAVYSYPSGQRPGCGFPTMGVLALYSLNSGAILTHVKDKWSAHDYRLFRQVWPHLQSGDIVLGDRAFGSYEGMALLPLQGIDMVIRHHQRRSFNRRKAMKIGDDDWLVTWVRPKYRKKQLMPLDEWIKLPTEIIVRIIHIKVKAKGFRTKELWISTTLLDHVAYSAEKIAALYLRRWELELCFRDLKTTMGMEKLRCLSPEMVHKELLAFLIAHNFIRCVIAKASTTYDCSRTRISFKGTLDASRSFIQAIRQARSKREARRLYDRLLEILASDAVPFRPNRLEPRAVKKRPKNYQRLTKPRHIFMEIQHRSQYKAKKKHA
jgi:hypothetical protein